MRATIFAVLAATSLLSAVPLAAQEIPLKAGDFWSVTDIKINDGHTADYADYLAGTWRKSMDWQVSKGYIKGYKMLTNVNPRSGEPDMFLVTIYDHVPSATEADAQTKAVNAYLATTDRSMEAASGERAKYRQRMGSSLLQEEVWKK